MGKVEHYEVAGEEAGLRLDRWFRRHFPQLTYSRLAKLIRTGQVRVDGGRTKPDLRLAAGQRIRVPPLRADSDKPVERAPVSDTDVEFMRGLVIYKDDDMIAIDKPAGLAVQGGTKTRRHVDAMLDALKFDKSERPRLVHRLDRDTSGVLLLARSAAAASRLARSFQSREVRKVYWALCVGVPRPERGIVNLPLGKQRASSGGRLVERMETTSAESTKSAVTYFATLAVAGRKAAWLALMPVTGRTHQLRVHCAAMGHPIVGDGKYGGAQAELALGSKKAARLYLHARSVELPRATGTRLRIVAPLPPHMVELWALFEFDAAADIDPFAEIRP